MSLPASSSRQRSGKDKEQVGQSTLAAGWTKAGDAKKITAVESDQSKVTKKAQREALMMSWSSEYSTSTPYYLPSDIGMDWKMNPRYQTYSTCVWGYLREYLSLITC